MGDQLKLKAGVRKERPWRQHWCSSVPVATLVALAASAFQWSLFRPTSHYWSPFGLPPAPHILLLVRFYWISQFSYFFYTVHGFSVKLVYWTMFRPTSQWSPFTLPPGPHIYAWPLWAMATFRYIFILSAVGVRSSSQWYSIKNFHSLPVFSHPCPPLLNMCIYLIFLTLGSQKVWTWYKNKISHKCPNFYVQ